MFGNESSPLISVMGTKVPRNESSTHGTFVPGNESSLVRKFQLPSAAGYSSIKPALLIAYICISCATQFRPRPYDRWQ